MIESPFNRQRRYGRLVIRPYFLRFNSLRDQWDMLCEVPGSDVPRLVRSIDDETVRKWKRPDRVFAYIAQRDRIERQRKEQR